MMHEKSTYVRKIGAGQYEYGSVKRARNFRKQPDIFEPAGTSDSVAGAEAGRSRLDHPLPLSRPADMRQIFSDGDNTHRFSKGRSGR